MVQVARNLVVDLANFTPASAEKGYLSAARFMSPELLSRFEPVAREQLKQVVTNKVSQFFTVDSFRVTLRHVETTQQNPYGPVVTSVEQTEPAAESAAGGKPGR